MTEEQIEDAYIAAALASGKTPRQPITVKPFRIEGELYVYAGGVGQHGHRGFDALQLYDPDVFREKFPGRELRLEPRFEDGMSDFERQNAYWGVRVRPARSKGEMVIGPNSTGRKLTTKNPADAEPGPMSGFSSLDAEANIDDTSVDNLPIPKAIKEALRSSGLIVVGDVRFAQNGEESLARSLSSYPDIDFAAGRKIAEAVECLLSGDARSCRACGCTHSDPCDEGCAWVPGDETDEGPICSACGESEEADGE